MTIDIGYTAHDGTWREWKHDDNERPQACCYDCGLPYGVGPFGDLSIPHDIWELINPTHHQGAGLLCPNCIFERLAIVGKSGFDAAIFTAGMAEDAQP